MLQQYKQYNDEGFEVVGICLDSEREKAKSYIEDEELPWESLFQEHAGWKQPMAVKYKISAIPTAILVDRDGKVVSLTARGDELPKLLETQFGSSANSVNHGNASKTPKADSKTSDVDPAYKAEEEDNDRAGNQK